MKHDTISKGAPGSEYRCICKLLPLFFRCFLSLPSLWDPWGVFFIYLTYEIGISDYKGVNSGWMNLG